MLERRRILVIAGSDSSGGAGLEADQKVIAHHHCYAMTATTALTAQNTQGVRGINHIPPEFVTEQINAVFDDIGVDVVKIGMLASAETVDVVARILHQHYQTVPIVLDPVMVATSGAQLLPDEAVDNLRQKMLPISTVLTPNIPEAKLLLHNAGHEIPRIASVADIIRMAEQIQRLGPRYVLLKGGHLPLSQSGQICQAEDKEKGQMVILNVLHDGEQATLFQTDYVASRNTHGTGCSLASAIASQMVVNRDGGIVEQIKTACQYVEMGIRTHVNVNLGSGSGAINHFHDANDQASLRILRGSWWNKRAV